MGVRIPPKVVFALGFIVYQLLLEILFRLFYARHKGAKNESQAAGFLNEARAPGEPATDSQH
jgi:hypothetical protein